VAVVPHTLMRIRRVPTALTSKCSDIMSVCWSKQHLAASYLIPSFCLHSCARAPLARSAPTHHKLSTAALPTNMGRHYAALCLDTTPYASVYAARRVLLSTRPDACTASWHDSYGLVPVSLLFASYRYLDCRISHCESGERRLSKHCVSYWPVNEAALLWRCNRAASG